MHDTGGKLMPLYPAGSSVGGNATVAPTYVYQDTQAVAGANNFNGRVAAAKFTLSSDATVSEIGMLEGGAPAGNFRGAVYTDNAGACGSLLCETASVARANAGNWTYTPVTSIAAAGASYVVIPNKEIRLPAGTYWLAVQTDNAATVFDIADGANRVYYTQAYGAFPASFVKTGNTAIPNFGIKCGHRHA